MKSSSGKIVSSRSLHIRSLLALSLVAVITGLGRYYVGQRIVSQQEDGFVINVAGRQRMLSQRLAKNVYKLANPQAFEGLVDFSSQQSEFDGSYSSWVRAHGQIIRWSEQPHWQSKVLSDAVSELKQEYQALVVPLRKATNTPLELRTAETFTQAVSAVVEHESKYLESMHRVVGVFEAQTLRNLESIGDMVGTICAIVLLVLIFEFLFVFSPAIQQILATQSALVEASEQAQQGVQSKAQFLATMSHEIRTPMNAVLACTDLLLSQHPRPEDRKLLSTIRNSGDTLLALINDILDFSKIESGKMSLESESFDIKVHTREVIELLDANSSKKGLTVTVDIDPAVPQWVLGDVTRYRQLLFNLVGNATKFAESRVQVRVTAKHLSVGGKLEIHCSIQDDGIGMSEEQQGKLFKQFSQADASTTRKYGGTGLGLSICKGITDAMGGQIWVQSEEGVGSIFQFKFPSEESKPVAQKKSFDFSKASKKTAVQCPISILVVEDNPVNQLIIQNILARFGYKVDIAENGQVGVDRVRAKSYDLVFMDFNMPVMDGLEATKSIRGQDIHQPVIVALTANAFAEDRAKCIEAGMNAFLTKPIEVDRLIEAFIELGFWPEDIFDAGESAVAKSAGSGRVDAGYAVPVDYMIQSLGVDEDFVDELVGVFLGCASELLEDLRSAIDDRDSGRIEAAAHKLKGAASQFQPQEVLELSLKLEHMGRDGQHDGIDQTFATLEQSLVIFVSELNQYMDRAA